MPAAVILETVQPAARDAFRADLLLAQRAVRAGVVESRAKSADNVWELWMEFCTEHSIDPTFEEDHDPAPHLQVFAARVRDGRHTARGKPV